MGFYISPILGGKIKETLSVKCRDQDEICFNSGINDWKVTKTKYELRPVVGISTGIKIDVLHFVEATSLFIKTDFEDTYYGIEVSLRGKQ